MLRGIFFDMDGTAVRYERGEFHSSWDALGHALCDREAWDAALAYYYPRRDEYGAWLRHNAGLLRGRRPEDAAAALFPGGRPPYSEGFVELVEAVRGRLVTGIISSGVDLVSGFIAADLGLTVECSNRLLVHEGRFTGEVDEQVPLWSKDEVLRRIAAACGLDLAEVAFAGDSENDIPALRIAGMPVLFRPKPLMGAFRAEFERQRGRPLLVIDDFRQLIPLLTGAGAETGAAR